MPCIRFDERVTRYVVVYSAYPPAVISIPRMCSIRASIPLPREVTEPPSLVPPARARPSAFPPGPPPTFDARHFPRYSNYRTTTNTRSSSSPELIIDVIRAERRHVMHPTESLASSGGQRLMGRRVSRADTIRPRMLRMSGPTGRRKPDRMLFARRSNTGVANLFK